MMKFARFFDQAHGVASSSLASRVNTKVSTNVVIVFTQDKCSRWEIGKLSMLG